MILHLLYLFTGEPMCKLDIFDFTFPLTFNIYSVLSYMYQDILVIKEQYCLRGISDINEFYSDNGEICKIILFL